MSRMLKTASNFVLGSEKSTYAERYTRGFSSPATLLKKGHVWASLEWVDATAGRFEHPEEMVGR